MFDVLWKTGVQLGFILVTIVILYPLDYFVSEMSRVTQRQKKKLTAFSKAKVKLSLNVIMSSRGGRGTAPSIPNIGLDKGVSLTHKLLHHREKKPIPSEQDAVVSPGAGLNILKKRKISRTQMSSVCSYIASNISKCWPSILGSRLHWKCNLFPIE